MLHRILKTSIILLIVLAIGTFAFGQRQTGSLTGKVTDTEGTPLPGVSITLSGPALMGTMAFTSTADGDFRFPALPPGSDYVLTVELSGFKTLKRGGVIISVGKTVTITIQLEAATIAEEVTVIAETPAVDVKSSKVSVTYSSDLIKNIPVARDYYDIITTAPGIVSDNSQFRTFSSHGGSARMNQVAVDGINITDGALGEQDIAVPFDTYEEVEFELGFHQAEVPIAEGAYVNIVTKSGGNKFSGAFNLYYFNDSMTKSLIPESEAQAVGLNEPSGFKRWGDYSLSLGGPIVKDKLWFFANGRYIDWTREGETIVDGVFEAPHEEIQTFAKLTFKPHPNWKISGVWKFSNFDEPYLIFVDDYYRALENTLSYDNRRDNAVLAMVNWIADQNTFFDLRFTYSAWLMPEEIQPDADPFAPFTSDLFTGISAGPGFWSQDLDSDRYAVNFSGTRFLDNVLGGDHELKAGIEYEKNVFRYEPYKAYPVLQLQWNNDPWLPILPFPGGIVIATTNGAERGDFPVVPDTWRISAYLQDSFTIADRLTLNLGVRYNEMHANAELGSGKEQTPALASDPVFVSIAPDIFTTHIMPDRPNIIVWKDLSPRIGAVYDLFGDGKTSIKASWARYVESFIMDYYFLVSPVPSVVQIIWIDANVNKQLDPFGQDFYFPDRAFRNPSTYDPEDYVDSSLQTPRTDEFIVGIERELFKDFSLGLSFIYKKKTRITEGVDRDRGNDPNGEWWVPYTVTEPGWDGQLGTSDDSQLTVYGVKAGAPGYEVEVSNPRGAERKYQAIELIAQKRMSNRWQFLGSLTLSKFEGNVGASYGYSGGNTRGLENPNGYVNGYGRLDMDRPVLIKLQGSVQLPLDFMLSAYYFHASGVPWNRTLTVSLPLFIDPRFDTAQPTQFTVNAEAPGSRRRQARNNLDLRVEKTFTIGNFGQVGIFLDVLNALGERWFEINQDPGGTIFADGSFLQNPQFGQFTSANGLRTYKLSVRFTF